MNILNNQKYWPISGILPNIVAFYVTFAVLPKLFYAKYLIPIKYSVTFIRLVQPVSSIGIFLLVVLVVLWSVLDIYTWCIQGPQQPHMIFFFQKSKILKKYFFFKKNFFFFWKKKYWKNPLFKSETSFFRFLKFFF